jgi:anti-sigma regulatory factor (Ser/Thr protein kinase)
MYDGLEDFVARTSPLVRAATLEGAAVLVVVPEPQLTALRRALGDSTSDVTFTDMATVGRNPGRLISLWDDFVGTRGKGRAIRGIGEPVWAGRSPDTVVECQIHEELLDVAFGDAESVDLVCPYDVRSLSSSVIAEARRSHEPGRQARDRSPFWRPLRPAPEGAHLRSFDARGVRDLRGLIAGLGAHVGLTSERTSDVVLAVNEIVTNSVRHGGGGGTLRAWVDGDAVVCEVNDGGYLRDPLVGRLRPPADSPGGRGLWLANQLCDLVQVRNGVEGCVVRVRVEGCREH